MKLVVVYGPPAVGKLTVAKELARITGFDLFHNHLSLDSAGKPFAFGSPEFNEAVVKHRKEMLEDAARRGTDMIFTSAFIKGDHQRVANELSAMIREHGGETCFVYLCAPEEVLLKRVTNKERKRYGKIIGKKELEAFLKAHKVSKTAPISGSLPIDTSKTGPHEAAMMIARRFGLRRLQGQSSSSSR